MRFAVSCVALALVASCSTDLPFGDALLTCSSVAQCPQDAACIAGYCAPAGSPCISGSGATARAVTDGTPCTTDHGPGVCSSGQCAICGDRIVEPGETCDDGNDNNSDGCTQKCNPPTCGDGFLQDGEECDDGNTARGDACGPTCVANTCGDESVDAATEDCDDGNDNENDDCSHCQRPSWAASIVVGYGLNHVASSYTFHDVEAVVSDGGHGVYISDAGSDVIWRFDDAANRLTPITSTASTGGPNRMPDGAVATQSNVGMVGGLAVRNDGDLYVGASLGVFQTYYDDDINAVLRFTSDTPPVPQPVVLRIDANGAFHNVAGTGAACPPELGGDACGNGQPGQAADLYQLTALAFDLSNNLLIGDYYTLWRLDLTTNILTRLLGSSNASYILNQCLTPFDVPYCHEGEDARNALVARIGGIVVDRDGGIILSDSGTARLLRIDPETNIVTRLASDGLMYPKGLSRAADGTIYIADRDAHRVFALSADYQTLVPVVGSGTGCSPTDVICGADDQASLVTTLNAPSAVLVEGDARLLIADSHVNRIRRSTNGTVSLAIGATRGENNGQGFAGTSLVASSLTLDQSDRVLFGFDDEVLRIDATSGLADYVAGSYFNVCKSGPCGDGGPASSASFGNVIDMAMDAAGNLYLVSSDNARIRKIDTSGNVSTIAGNDTPCPATGQDGYGSDTHAANCGTATTNPTAAIFWRLRKIEVIGSSLYTLEYDNTRAIVRKLDLAANTIAIIAGATGLGAANGTEPAANAKFSCPLDISAGPNGSLLIADTLNCAVREITNDTTIATLASVSASDCYTDPADESCLTWDPYYPEDYGTFLPTSVTTDGEGNVVAYDHASHKVLRYSGGAPTAIMGDGTATGPLFGVTATLASFAPDASATAIGVAWDFVRSMQFDAAGNLFIYEYPDSVIVELDTAGHVSPVVVNTDELSSGTVATARLHAARAFVRDNGATIIADDVFVRRLASDASRLDTVMGNADGANETFDNNARYHAPLGAVTGLAEDASAHRIFVADGGTSQLFVLGTSGDTVSWTLDAYSQATGSGFADGAFASARFNGPRGMAYDAVSKRLYVADAGNNIIRSVDDAAGTVSTIAGTPRLASFSGDNGPATSATLNQPSAIAIASDGSLYIADTNNNRVRRVATSGVITTVLGTGLAENVAGQPSTTGAIAAPRGLRFDTFGNLWVTAGRAVHVIVGDTGAPPDGTTTSFLAYATTPKDGFPDSIIGCLNDVDVGDDDVSMVLLDGCQGLVLKLTQPR